MPKFLKMLKLSLPRNTEALGAIRRLPNALLAWLALGLLLASPAQSLSISIGAQLDNTLIESPTGDVSNGQGDGIYAGRILKDTTFPPLRRGLLSFDIAGALPVGATVESVSLSLTRVMGSSAPPILDLHRVTTQWGEGASSSPGGTGAPAQTGDATWLHAILGTSTWMTAGGDFVPTASAGSPDALNNVFTWSSVGLIDDVQEMLDDPTSNFGWILFGDEVTRRSMIKFASRENPSVDARPSLTIEYSMIPEPGTGLLFGLGLSGLTIFERRSASGV